MKHIPERMCVICRRRFPRADLNRFVMSSQGSLVPDARKSMPGRGFWLCNAISCQMGFAKFRPKSRLKRRQGEI